MKAIAPNNWYQNLWFEMVDEGKIKVKRFDGVNFGFWKMQTEDYLYQKDLYLPLGGKTHKPKEMSDSEREILNRKALGAI